MVKTKGITRTVDRYLRRVRVAVPDYEAGVKDPKIPWDEATVAAKEVYRAAITDPKVPDKFEAGVKKVGIVKWRDMALKKGSGRFVPGVELGKPYYEGIMKDILAQIEAIVLPARGPRGDPKNLDRVRAIFEALHAWRLARLAVS